MARYLAAILLHLLVSGEAWADPATGTCAGVDVTAISEDPSVLGLICDTVRDHAERLGACGITQSRPITVSAVSAIPGMPPNCVGAFHCATDLIEVALPENLAARERDAFIYSGLDPEVIFASVIRHELAHAFAEHTTEAAPVSGGAHEYIAYALQLDAMSDADRNTFLDHNGRRPAKSRETFSILIAGLAPGPFASAAWLHFSAPENGCDFVARVIAREVVLGARMPDP